MTKAKQYFARSSAAIHGALKKLATRGAATRPINNLYNFLEKRGKLLCYRNIFHKMAPLVTEACRRPFFCEVEKVLNKL